MSKTENESHEYDDIIEMEHHVSSKRPHMPASDRAAQFAPFAALTGLDRIMKETEIKHISEYEK